MHLFETKKEKANTADNSSENNKASICQLKKNVETAEEELLAELLLEAHRVFENNLSTNEEIEQFISILEGLSPKVLGPIGYELAKMGLSCGHSGLHGVCKSKVPFPFEFLAWAGGFVYGGIAFKINMECFQKEETRLFFTTKDYPYHPYADNTADELKSIIWNNSSQVGNISVMIEKNNENHYSRIEFSVRKNSMPWGPIKLQNGSIPSSVVNAPVIQLPYIGEFNCCLGEVTPNGDVILHRDDFCMK